MVRLAGRTGFKDIGFVLDLGSGILDLDSWILDLENKATTGQEKACQVLGLHDVTVLCRDARSSAVLKHC